MSTTAWAVGMDVAIWSRDRLVGIGKIIRVGTQRVTVRVPWATPVEQFTVRGRVVGTGSWTITPATEADINADADRQKARRIQDLIQRELTIVCRTLTLPEATAIEAILWPPKVKP